MSKKKGIVLQIKLSFIDAFFATLVLGLVFFQACADQQNRPGKNEPLNVLFIAVDDLRPELGAYGQSHIISPNIDRLADSGMLFERAYVQQAVCAPSRISLLSGLRPDATQTYKYNSHLPSDIPNLVTLPGLFKQHGYETVSLGKVYHHKDDDLQSWSKPPHHPDGSWTGRGYLAPASVKVVNEHPELGGRGPAYEAADVADNMYSDGKMTALAIKELNRMKDKPFFLAVGFRKPHLPFNAPEKYWDLYDPEQIKLPSATQPPKDVPELALTNWGELRNYYGIPEKGDLNEELTRALIHGYYACVSYIDALIGKLMDELKRLQLDKNTIVILWGDHGYKLGEYGDWCKHTNFELDTRVPLVISVPGMKNKGRRTSALVETVDIYPTLAELTGLPLPDHLQGVSFVPLLENPEESWKKAAFSQYPRGGDIMGYSLRTDRYRFTRWQHIGNPDQIEALELYDHRKDPMETVNQIENPEYTDVIEKLAEIHKEGWRNVNQINSK